jgi:hypothetical protein
LIDAVVMPYCLYYHRSVPVTMDILSREMHMGPVDISPPFLISNSLAPKLESAQSEGLNSSTDSKQGYDNVQSSPHRLKDRTVAGVQPRFPVDC